MRITMRGTVCNKLDEAAMFTGLKKSTIVDLAFYNGLKSKELGYRCIPKRAPEGSLLTIRITVSENMEKGIEALANETNYSKRVLMETFIELECDRLIKHFKKYNEEDEEGNEPEEPVSFNIRIKLPEKVKIEIENDIKNIDISDNQYFSYLLLQGFSFHERNYAPLTQDKDYNLAQEIMRLGIDPVKAYTLISFLAEYYFKEKELDMDKVLSHWVEINNSKKQK